MKTWKSSFFIHLFLSVILFAACGGSGGTGMESNSSDNSGSVAIFLADSPADAYEAINMWIKEVSLIPHEESGQGPIIIYESQDPNGYMINLLDYADNDFLLTVRHHIPAGSYEKIRLKIEKIKSRGGDCDPNAIKVPSKKIDLNPRGGFYVEQGTTMAIRLDIDVNKSMQLHSAEDKCIFRPVVFVDIGTIKMQPRCPKIFKGQINDIIGEDKIEGLVLKLPGNRGALEVYFLDETVVFDDEGYPFNEGDYPVPEGVLSAGQTVWVRGKLDSYGHFHASEVVIGEIVILKGIVESNPQDQKFFLRLVKNQGVSSPNISVELTDGTLVLVGCDTNVDSTAITKDLPVKVFGKLSFDKQILRAIVLFLKPVSGELISKEAAEYSFDQETVSGSDLIIRDNENKEIPVFLPEYAPIYLVGDGDVPPILLCPGRQVQAGIDPDQSEKLEVLTASDLKVHPDRISSWVESVDIASNTLVVDGITVYVQPRATIMDLSTSVDNLVDFENIWPNDKVSCFGLEACPSDTSDHGFYAFVILIVKDWEDENF